ncbi:anaerobic glycerol-3-phosphate dehydrogenase subunit C [bacterium]|nr:anaerobic glycerol-3-phosphate dehydrogenase subunit C [bacterium]
MRSLERQTVRLLQSAFRRRINGDVYFDDQTRLQYSTAACNYRIFPQVIIMPRDGDDVAETVRIARELNIPVTPRGAGVGLTGGCLGRGIIIDFSREMNRVLSIDVSNNTVVVEPGIIQNDLDRAIRRHNLFFPPDPSSHMYSTIGGMVGNNAAGPHSVKYGTTRDYLHSVSAVCGDGEELILRNNVEWESLPSGRLKTLSSKIVPLLQDNAQLLADYLPKTRKNSSGYRIDNIVNSKHINLANLMAASEGTLGIFTGLELRVIPLPKVAGMLLLLFDSVESACEAVPVIAKTGPSMLEIMESTFIDLVRKSTFDVGVPFPLTLRSLLLVEFDGDSTEEVNNKIRNIERELVGPGRLAMSSRRGVQKEERERLERIRKAASPILNRIPAPYRPIKFIEDTVVPVAYLPEYIKKLHALFDRFGIRGVIFGHAGDGHIHVNPLMDMTDRDLLKKMKIIADETSELVKEFGGTLSGEHGDGLLRSPFLPDFFGPLFPVFKTIKNIFDPANILNPGKIVCDENQQFTDNMKLRSPEQTRETGTDLDQSVVRENLFTCSSCGACRSYCPVCSATSDERMSPRSKANLLMRIIGDEFPPENMILSPDHKQILDYCIQCGTCLTECPSGVNIPLLMQLAKQVSNEHNGLSLADRIISETGAAVALTRLMPNLSNRVMNNSVIRKALELTVGLDSRRKLAPFSDIELHSLAKETSSCDGHKIIYFPGCTAKANDPLGEGSATLAVLSHHGFAPFIPDTNCCGIASISIGLIDHIKPQAKKNVDLLHELTSGGINIITSAPSCGMALRHEYPLILKSEKSLTVAKKIRDIHEFLVELLSGGNLDTRFESMNLTIAVHQPCHSRAVGIGEYPIRLLELIPQLKVHQLEPRCCGIAGTYGMKKKNYDFSMQIGKQLFREISLVKPDLIATPCGTCRIQIESATGIDTIHPISLLAKAYGLLPIHHGLI